MNSKYKQWQEHEWKSVAISPLLIVFPIKEGSIKVNWIFSIDSWPFIGPQSIAGQKKLTYCIIPKRHFDLQINTNKYMGRVLSVSMPFYIIKKQKYEEMSINMASDPEKLEHFTITSTVWHLYADRDCKQQL